MNINQSDLATKITELSNKMSNESPQKTDGRQLIETAEDILNFLFVLKSQNKTVDLDPNKLDQMIQRLENIQFDQSIAAQARKKYLSNFLYNLKHFNIIESNGDKFKGARQKGS